MSLVSIQKIHSIHPHSNADRLECAMILGWPVVIPKGVYKDGELVVFIEIDAIVPKENSYFAFMEKQRYRTWPAKFRNEPSMGLVCPLSILPPGEYIEDQDVTSISGVIKYERAEHYTFPSDSSGGFPTSLISVSDEDNIRGKFKALTELEGKEMYNSVKVDGSSSSFIMNKGEFFTCSRRLKMKPGNGYSGLMAEKYDLENKLKALGVNIAIQAECVGPGRQGNRMGLPDLQLRIFRAKNLDTCQIYSLTELKDLCGKLEVPMVDVVQQFVFDGTVHTIDWFQAIADGLKYGNGQPAEGIVFAPTTPFYSQVMKKSWSAKIISQNYKQS